MKILINTPYLSLLGGVANHYLGLKDYWSETVLYNQIGRRGVTQGAGKYTLLVDVLKFLWKILIFRPDIILLNPSLARNAVLRDTFFLRIAKIFNKKVAVFFHGFNKKNLKEINRDSLVRNLNKCECIFVLAQEFVDDLRMWGVAAPIHLTTTKVMDRMVGDINAERRSGNVGTILFLARIAENKGIFIALKSFKQILEIYPELHLKVVGDGPALNEARSMCESENVKNVTFTGALTGEDLINAFKESDLYLLPTYYEGMPTSVLEAMAFGLPVITRPVGGLCSFFKNGIMGEMVNSYEPSDFTKAILPYIQDKSKTRQAAIYNINYAKENFLASKVASNLETVLRKYI